MIYFYKIIKKIRHARFWEKADFFWDFLRKAFFFLCRILGRGVKIYMGDQLFITIPPESADREWENYEKKPVAATIQWLNKYPRSFVIDIGCNLGLYSAVVLFASRYAEVLGIDSYLYNLKITKDTCRYSDLRRLYLIHGLIMDKHLKTQDAAEAKKTTEQGLWADTRKPDVHLETFVNVQDHDRDPAIPVYSLDGLFLDNDFNNRPVLIKCDVEGAELFVLRGAERLLEKISPVLLISIHEYYYSLYKEDFGYTKSDVRNFLESKGYSITVLSADHEEHWWCQKDEK